MKVFIILATIALAHGAKLEKTYLPPSHAQTSGGSGNFLQTPIERAGRTNSGFSNNGFQSAPGFAQTGNGLSQSGNGLAQTEAGFEQSAPGFLQGGIEITKPGNTFAKSAQFDNVNGFNNFGNFEARPERPRAALERNAAILRQDNSNDGENYSYSYETENGIYAEESGVAANGVEAQGGFSYTGDDGQVYSIRYTADQNGFVPVGDHLPTPPPVPEEILRALEQNARDEAAGIYDDGSYNEAKYAAGDINTYNGQSNNYNTQYNNFNGQPSYQQQKTFGNDEDTVVTNAAFSRSQNYPTEGLETPKVSSEVSGSAIPRGPTTGTPRGPTTGTPRGPTSGTSRGLGLDGPSSGAVDKAYLPPFATQGRFGRRQNFDSRNGYHY